MNKRRLDQFLVQQHPHFSRSQIKKLIEEGYVLVNGEKRKPSYLLHGGEKIEILRRTPPLPKAEPEAIALTILYEDEEVLVINKEAGMVVHPAPGNPCGTLVNAVLNHLLNQRKANNQGESFSDPIRPGIVHRLDKGTSGVMVVAKTDRAQKGLASQFRDRRVEKSYLAVVFGMFREKRGKISRPIGRDLQHRRKFSSRTRRAREAVTHFEVQEGFSSLSLLLLKPETGRTHQIRVHLSELHHPIVGDTTYGAKSFLSSIKEEKTREILSFLHRPLLHAWRLAFYHPRSGEKVLFEAPLPEDFKEVLKNCLSCKKEQ